MKCCRRIVGTVQQPEAASQWVAATVGPMASCKPINDRDRLPRACDRARNDNPRTQTTGLPIVDFNVMRELVRNSASKAGGPHAAALPHSLRHDIGLRLTNTLRIRIRAWEQKR
jgi:hypothetical protein